MPNEVQKQLTKGGGSMSRRLYAVIFALLAGCGDSPDVAVPAEAPSAAAPPPSVPAEEVKPTEALPTPSPAVAVSDDDLGRICRATVAALNGRDPAIIGVDKIDDGIAYVTYARPDDGKVWKNRCRLEGDRVIWGGVDMYGPGSGLGRWRTHPEDEIITFTLDGQNVKIRLGYSDGSGSEETYQIAN